MPWTIIASFALLVLAWPVALAIVWRPVGDAFYWLGLGGDRFLLGWPFWCLLARGALLLNLGTLIGWALCVLRALMMLGSTFR